jgi:hypothetical protein
MCGMPIISTVNYDFANYFTNKDAIYANSMLEVKQGVNKILGSKDLRNDLSFRAREVALNHFHIKDYIEKWNYVFYRASR